MTDVFREYFVAGCPFLSPSQQCQSTEELGSYAMQFKPLSYDNRLLLWCCVALGGQGSGCADAQASLWSLQRHQAASRWRGQYSQGVCNSPGASPSHTHCQLLGCIAVPRTWMRPVVSDRVAWSVCRSVTLVSPANIDDPIEMLSGCGLGCTQGTVC